MKKLSLILLSVLLLTACSKEEDPVLDYSKAVPLVGVEAEVAGGLSTRVAPLDEENYVGRSAFINNDLMVFTSIKRTDLPIDGFSYLGIVYKHTIGAGQTSGGWNRDDEQGRTEASANVPDRIYWSDAANNHTFIGYSLPQQPAGADFHWAYTSATNIYEGTLGQNADPNIIDHTTNDKIKYDDLLLTYDTEKVAETGGSVAKLFFRHALAMVRIAVNITGFSASNMSDDTKSVVSDMQLKGMKTRYTWYQNSSAVVASATGQVLKDARLWIPRPDGTGTGIGKQFVFYGLAVPDIGVTQDIDFDVTYPEPMNPSATITRTYHATISGIEYRAGHCTTINISLNHQNEEMTIGAEYMEWQYEEYPNLGELKTNPTILTAEMTNRANFTIATDPKATEDDATWLYDSGSGILDIYGNDGTEAHPYTICTAQQLVSFAYEVKSGRAFTGQYVKLDANMVLQPKAIMTGTGVDWPGIGDETHPFDGNFLGGVRLISQIKKNAFFHTLGPNAHVNNLIILSTYGGIEANGGFANVNYGIICGSKFAGDMEILAKGDSDYVGGFVGDNYGLIFACIQLGSIKSDAHIGGIAGRNYSVISSSFAVTSHIHTTAHTPYCGGVTAFQATTREPQAHYPPTLRYCYYDRDVVSNTQLADATLATGLTTTEMQRERFVGSKTPKEFLQEYKAGTPPAEENSLNYGIYKWAVELAEQGICRMDSPDFEHLINRYYVFMPASYPYIW